MIVTGVVLLSVAFLAKITTVCTVGIILIVIRAGLFLPGSLGHAVGGRRLVDATAPCCTTTAGLGG